MHSSLIFLPVETSHEAASRTGQGGGGGEWIGTQRNRPSESFVVLPRNGAYSRGPLASGMGVSGQGMSTLQPTLTSAQTFEASSIDPPTSPVRGSISQRLRTISKTTDLATGTAEPSGPVCRECADLLLDIMARRLAEMEAEKARYMEFVEISEASSSGEENSTSLEESKKMKELTDEERALTEAIKACEAQLHRLASQWEEAERERAEVDALESTYWCQVRDVEREIWGLTEERDTLERKMIQEERALRSLERTNVYDEAFHIDLEGSAISKINGLRLGRLPTEHVRACMKRPGWSIKTE